MSELSIIIPVYNAEKFLKETLLGIQSQTFTDFECIIVNDGSTDNSLEIIKEFAETDNRFKCFTIPNSGNANIPVKYGVGKSNTDYVMSIGHDDYLQNDCIEKMHKKKHETNADIVLLELIGCEDELKGESYRLPLTSFNKDEITSGKKACSMTIGVWQFSCNGMLVKKELYRGVPVGNLMNSDELTSRYLLYNAERVAFSDGIYYYRNHDSSISRALSPRIFEKLIVDDQLENFVSSRYNEDSGLPKKMRNTRFFNLLYLHSEYYKNKRKFSREKQLEIIKIIKDAYFSQNFELLKKELPKYKFIFFSSFKLFCINSIIYRKIKNLQRKKYILK